MNRLHLNITDSDNSLDDGLAMEIIDFFQFDRGQATKIKGQTLASAGNWKTKASAIGHSRNAHLVCPSMKM